MNNHDKPLCDVLPNGHTYQNGIRPGPRKLEQFRGALTARQTPALYSTDGQGKQAVATVKLFDPCGSWTWYLTEWDHDGQTEAFGLVIGHEPELGYIDLAELANVRGALGLGIEIDMHWTPRPLTECS